MAMVTRIKEEGIKSLTRGCGTLASSQHVHPKIREMILEMMRADTHHTPSSSYTHTYRLIHVYNIAREQGHTYSDKKARKKNIVAPGKHSNRVVRVLRAITVCVSRGGAFVCLLLRHNKSSGRGRKPSCHRKCVLFHSKSCATRSMTTVDVKFENLSPKSARPHQKKNAQDTHPLIEKDRWATAMSIACALCCCSRVKCRSQLVPIRAHLSVPEP